MIIRLIQEGEAERCNDFRNRNHARARTLAQWRWEFIPATHKFPLFPFAVAEDDGRIVGTQALIPIRMADNAGVYWTAKSEETLVDPAYRGRGLSVRMYECVFEFAEQNGFTEIWGFTKAVKALLRAGFTSPGHVSQIFFPFSTRCIPVILKHPTLVFENRDTSRTMKEHAAQVACALAQSASRLRFSVTTRLSPSPRRSDAAEIRTLGVPPADCGEVCERFVSQWGGTTIYRDADYLRWRLFGNPWLKATVRGLYDAGQFRGWAAYGMADDGMGYLADLLVTTDESSTMSAEDMVVRLLADCVIGTRRMGAVGIRGWQVTPHPFDRLVARMAKRLGFYHIQRGGPAVVYSTSHGRRRNRNRQFQDWYVTRIFTEGLLG